MFFISWTFFVSWIFLRTWIWPIHLLPMHSCIQHFQVELISWCWILQFCTTRLSLLDSWKSWIPTHITAHNRPLLKGSNLFKLKDKIAMENVLSIRKFLRIIYSQISPINLPSCFLWWMVFFYIWYSLYGQCQIIWFRKVTILKQTLYYC